MSADRETWLTETLSAENYEEVLALWVDAGLSIRPRGRDSRESFAAQIASGIQTVLGVRDEGHLVGVIVTTHDTRKGWMNRLAVHPDFRRKGIGLGLVRAGERVLRQQGMRIIAALVEEWNEASLALMVRAGFSDYTGVHYLTKREHDWV